MLRRNQRGATSDSRDVTCEWAREAISTRLDGEIDDADRARLDEHLARCADCSRYLTNVEALHRSVRVRASDPMPDLTDTIMQRLRTPARGRRRVRGLGVAAVALAGIGGVVTVLVADGDGDTPPELRSIEGIAAPAGVEANLSAYLTIVNDGGSDSLTDASSPSAERVTLHTTETENGLTKMRQRADYEIDGGTTTIFRPGGAHLMFERLRSDVDAGDELQLTLRFGGSGTRTVTVQVVPLADLVEQLEPAGTGG